jgi:hypothetical protein
MIATNQSVVPGQWTTRYPLRKRRFDFEDLRRILATLQEEPGGTFYISAIADAIGASTKSTSAALGKLLNAGLIARPQKGLYSSKGKTAAASAPPKPKKTKQIATAAQPTVAADEAFSIVTIDLLMEGEESKIDTAGILGKIRQDKNVLDARVRKIMEADRNKLQIRLALPNEK